ncbi:hypothetical protein Q7P37_003942 [Cladosporium fusiforme]
MASSRPTLAALLNPVPGSAQIVVEDDRIPYQAINKHGRYYHAWKAGKYPFPCDLISRDSYNILNGLAYLHCYVQRGLRTNEPLKDVVMRPLVDFHDGPPTKLLDLGCGSGRWVADVAESFPNAQVVGVDIVEGQDMYVPNAIYHVPNSIHGCPLDFSQDLSMLGLNSFDYVRMAHISGAVADEMVLIQRAWELCLPATGYVEFTFVDWTFRTPNGTLPYSNPLSRFHQMLTLASRARRIPLNPNPSDVSPKLTAVGFTDLIHRTHTLHLTPCSRDPRQFRIGELMRSALDMEGLGMGLLTQYLGMRADEVRRLIRECRVYLWDRDCRVFVELHTWTARKP